ncbi:DNA repair protein RecN [Pusillimonas minor]|uniref:DNA repair protein RecN n=1 Tax=Pusillimonas minor TaxID=2697024 RepID=A0A842HR01_9BURK|nr:DNA repair protein RecN [Pusillimonas minor]MBC2769790.1 DNA repair protein RecN [Pusillimonas minor]
MLQSLSLTDFVIVEHSEIQFDSGFTVFSGETGAGKSILIDALSLVLGARADTAFIRDGADKADISAVFNVPDNLAGWLAEHDLDTDDALMLRRVIDQQGKSRAYINGVPATLGQLRELGEQLVDIHGQHAHQSLLKPGSQRELLDTQGRHTDLVQHVAQAWQAWQTLAKQLNDARAHTDTLQEEQNRLEWQVNELEQLNLAEGEWDALSAEHNRLAHAQSLLENATQALSALDDDTAGAHHILNTAAHRLQGILRHDAQLSVICDALESARIATAEAISDLNSYISKLDLDPDALEQAEARMSAIFDAARKFRVEPEEIPALTARLRERLHETQAGIDLAALEAKAQAAQDHYTASAARLAAARKKAASIMAPAVTQAMQTLAMAGGRFDVAISPCAPGPNGTETIEFLVAAHTGTQPRPLAKVASGGELARLSLALSVIASQAARVPTLIFDEVDSGIGGGVAEVVGKLLGALGERHQVLCVTHLPQVAACGNHHFRVSKSQHKGKTASRIELLNKKARIEEIARMLGGLSITDTTRQHAAEMLGA